MTNRDIEIEELKSDIGRLRQELLYKERLLQEKLLENVIWKYFVVMSLFIVFVVG